MPETVSTRPSTAATKSKKGLRVERIFTTPGVHPYDEVTWERRDVVQTNWKSGEVIFEQRGAEFPDFWSVNASTIVTTKYFRGVVGTDNREWSLKQLIDRVVLTYTKAGKDFGYFATDGDAEIFEHELTWSLMHQVFSFNSPVWFNVGTAAPQQVSACFILSVDDTMDSILNWYREEGMIFKGGSGAGLNLSRIRSSKELLKSGGTASGPVSFMRGADASAGTIKSGGATRRAAKMVVLDIDHPDIEEFIETKVNEEEKIRALRDAGFDMDLGGKDIVSVQYQNANNSVRVSDEFMRAVEEGKSFGLRARAKRSMPVSSSARSLSLPGVVLIQESNTTTPLMIGTPIQRLAASMRLTHALNTCLSITHLATLQASTCSSSSKMMAHSMRLALPSWSKSLSLQWIFRSALQISPLRQSVRPLASTANLESAMRTWVRS